MNETYSEAISTASCLLAQAIRAHCSTVGSAPLAVDALLRSILREVGRETMSKLFSELATELKRTGQPESMSVHRSPLISVTTLFGVVRVGSPYLRSRRTGQTCRPLAELGLRHGTRTPAVERALTDFGSEESFGQASKRFSEHYGFDVGRTTVLRVVEGHAEKATKFVHRRLEEAAGRYADPLAIRAGVEQMIVELDGCEIRTGTLRPADSGEKSPVRRLPKRVRDEAWVDVRVGLARPAHELEPTYVARHDKYDVVVGDLFGAACERGLSRRTKVYAPSDGAFGLREALDTHFSGLRFVLDRPHLLSHLYDTADAIGLKDPERFKWVGHKSNLLDAGHVNDAIAELRRHKGRGKKRVERLIKYLTRFHDALGHDEIKAAGLPVASGEIESAHRTIPQRRLKLPGAWWRTDTLAKMLGLRVLRANGWWDEYWKAAA